MKVYIRESTHTKCIQICLTTHVVPFTMSCSSNQFFLCSSYHFFLFFSADAFETTPLLTDDKIANKNFKIEGSTTASILRKCMFPPLVCVNIQMPRISIGRTAIINPVQAPQHFCIPSTINTPLISFCTPPYQIKHLAIAQSKATQLFPKESPWKTLANSDFTDTDTSSERRNFGAALF